jgi:hypothetical protein
MAGKKMIMFRQRRNEEEDEDEEDDEDEDNESPDEGESHRAFGHQSLNPRVRTLKRTFRRAAGLEMRSAAPR